MEWLTKDEQVAQSLRELIESGEWTGQLPGYRKLEVYLKVHRVIIERALDRLMVEGLVGPAQPGKRRRIIKSSPQGRRVKIQETLLIYGPHLLDDFSTTQRKAINSIFHAAESDGWKVIYEFSNFGYPRKAVAQVKRLLRDHRPSRILLVLANVSLARWAASPPAVPCFTLGGETRAMADHIDGISVSFSQILCDACSRLRALGHRKILIPMISGKTELRELAINASRESWAADIPLVVLKEMFPEQGECLPDVLWGFWPKAFARSKPTAVIVKQNQEYLSLLSYCYQQGIRIPEDLSVMQLSSDPDCVWLNPLPDRFEFPVEKFTRKVAQWLQHPPTTPQGLELASAVYRSGGTLDKARAD